jgi:hypothetical protein
MYAILVTWLDGSEEYLKQGLSGTNVARFHSRKEAKKQKDFMLIGMSDEVESIDIVSYHEHREHGGEA